jgi:hypothetical protein
MLGKVVDRYEKRRVCVLVKAYPQPSQKYEETVCVAAVTEDHRLLRLYPVRFRHLDQSLRFNRFDWIELEMTRATEDPRPESFRVKEDTISVIKRARDSTPEERAKLWKPCVAHSLVVLQEEQKDSGRSLGIVRPDPDSIRFKADPIAGAPREDREGIQTVYKLQQSLLEEPLKKLPVPEYIFRYQFMSDGKQHTMQLHDWEVEATFHQYRRKYGSPEKALEMMVDFYERRAPERNLHLIMGTMHKRPWQFIIIGVLRTTADLDQVDAQKGLL